MVPLNYSNSLTEVEANLVSSPNNASENLHPMKVPKGQGFKMASLNILNSHTKHIDELRIVLSNQCVDSLAINETKLDGSVCDNR